MPTIICGSLAYDTIMVFQGRFQEHILPDQVHVLNVSFTVPQLRRDFGGCAGNIAYNLKLLGGEPLIVGTVGQDFDRYGEHLEALGISQSHILSLPTQYTAQAFITTDLDDNQITAFHPGAMLQAQHNSLRDRIPSNTRWAIVAPDGLDAMVSHLQELHAAGLATIFDPGQALPLFSGELLRQLIEQVQYLSVNDYECEMIQSRTQWNLATLRSKLQALIVTRGEKGSQIYLGSTEEITIPAAKATAVVDPTGCGDAYRAGLLYGLERGLSWAQSGRIASLMGALKIASAGTQNHSFTMEEFAQRYQESFGETLP